MQHTILCIDDDRNFCAILGRAFRAEGYEVRSAHDGDAALRALGECRPAVATLDILLPRRDGFAVLEAIRAQQGLEASTPVVLLSGCSPTDHYRRRAAELSAAALLTKPVPLEQLLAVVAKATGRPVAPVSQPAPGTRARSARPVAGSLEEIPFAALLHHLHGMRASGVLHLKSGRKRKKLQLRDGRPVAVKSNLVDECLGNLLAATGKISWDVMHESLRRVKQGEGPQGQILLAMHMLDEQDLARALHHQAEEKLFEIFGWSSGSFRFERGVRLQGANALALQRSPADLIMQGVRTRLPIEVVDRYLAAHAPSRLCPGESPYYRFQEIALAPAEEELLASLDGSRTLAECMPREEAARRLLYGALAVGLVEPQRSLPLAAGRPARAPARSPGAAATHAAGEPMRAGEEDVRAELAALAERLRGRDFFSVLDVEHRTTDEAVRRSYVELAKRTHPDRFSGVGEAVKLLAEEVFGIVSQAYDALSTHEGRIGYLRDLRGRERAAAELDQGHRALRAELEFQRGEACLRRKDHAEAAACFAQAVRIYPEEGEYHAHLGWAWYLAAPDEPGRLEEALAHVREARKLAPDREKPYLFLGRLYKAAGKAAIAERMFSRAMQLDPDCVEALRELRLMDMRRERSKGLMQRILRR